MHKAVPIVLALLIVSGTFLLTIFLSIAWPSICWLPRVGGTLVGIAVFIQGYVYANNDDFQSILAWKLTREQIYMYVANTAAVFGTLMWTFGDLVPQVLWFKNCACIVSC
jgi:hypothetical protein